MNLSFSPFYRFLIFPNQNGGVDKRGRDFGIRKKKERRKRKKIFLMSGKRRKKKSNDEGENGNKEKVFFYFLFFNEREKGWCMSHFIE